MDALWDDKHEQQAVLVWGKTGFMGLMLLLNIWKLEDKYFKVQKKLHTDKNEISIGKKYI